MGYQESWMYVPQDLFNNYIQRYKEMDHRNTYAEICSIVILKSAYPSVSGQYENNLDIRGSWVSSSGDFIWKDTAIRPASKIDPSRRNIGFQ